MQLDLQQGAIHFNWNEILPQELRLWVTEGKTRLTRADVEVVLGYLDDVAHQMEIYTDIAEGSA